MLAEDIIAALPHKDSWINQENDNRAELSITSQRLGSQVGTHSVIYTSPMDEIRITRMIDILAELYRSDRKLFEMILELLADPLASMASIARRLDTTRQNLSYHVHRAADQYPEIRTLLEIRQIKKARHE